MRSLDFLFLNDCRGQIIDFLKLVIGTYAVKDKFYLLFIIIIIFIFLNWDIYYILVTFQINYFNLPLV